jgi:hypothetical protein
VIAATVTPPRFPDHVAARVAAAWEDSRPAIPRLPVPGPRGPVDHDGDSDPDMDEALRRIREHGSALREGLAAYNEWAAGAVA